MQDHNESRTEIPDMKISQVYCIFVWRNRLLNVKIIVYSYNSVRVISSEILAIIDKRLLRPLNLSPREVHGLVYKWLQSGKLTVLV